MLFNMYRTRTFEFATFKGAGGTLGSDHGTTECLVVRGGHGGHFAENFVKNIFPSQSYHVYRAAICLSLIGNG